MLREFVHVESIRLYFMNQAVIDHRSGSCNRPHSMDYGYLWTIGWKDGRGFADVTVWGGGMGFGVAKV